MSGAQTLVSSLSLLICRGVQRLGRRKRGKLDEDDGPPMGLIWLPRVTTALPFHLKVVLAKAMYLC